jgi:uncharacterized membrane protein (UPF0127 family)
MPILNQSKASVIATTVKVAGTPSERMKGLLGRSSLDQDEALVITACQSIHMFFMKFAIDVIFVDSKGKVVGLCPNIQPFHLSPIFWRAHKAIEVPVGRISSSQTSIGDQISIQ